LQKKPSLLQLPIIAIMVKITHIYVSPHYGAMALRYFVTKLLFDYIKLKSKNIVVYLFFINNNTLYKCKTENSMENASKLLVVGISCMSLDKQNI